MYLALIHHWSHEFGQTEAGAHVSYGERVDVLFPLELVEQAWSLIEATRPRLFTDNADLPYLRVPVSLDKDAFMVSVERAKEALEEGREKYLVAYAYNTAEGSSQGEKWYLVRSPLLLEQGTHYDSANLAYQRAILGR